MLTDEEEKRVIEKAIFQAKKEKLENLELAERKKEYWQKCTNPGYPKLLSAKELRDKLVMTKTPAGKFFVIDKENQAQVNALCMYFSGDSRLPEYGMSYDKGILLMGGLGVGKTHLMSFFFQNQMASYVMVKCGDVENKWLHARPEDPDVISYYSNPIPSSINGNPYHHQELGICFDDLGRETIPSKRFGEEKNVMAEILMNRYDRKHPYGFTHVTTNLNGEKIKELYGDRVLDRMNEMFNVITFEGKSRRS